MADSIIERQIEKTIKEVMGEKAMQVLKGVSKIAARQGGDSAIENYQLLGKRALVAVGATLVVVNIVASVGGFILTRKSEQKRVEQIVRRVLEEERQKEQGEMYVPITSK